MIKTADSVKLYRSAKERFLKPVIMNFLARECPKLFGPIMREKHTERLSKNHFLMWPLPLMEPFWRLSVFALANFSWLTLDFTL